MGEAGREMGGGLQSLSGRYTQRGRQVTEEEKDEFYRTLRFQKYLGYYNFRGINVPTDYEEELALWILEECNE